MPISKAFAYLTPPGRGLKTTPAIGSKEIALGSGKLMNMLEGIFAGSAGPHDFQILFNPTSESVQENECRTLLINFQQSPSIATGLPIAERLQAVTDNRSGIGLLFLLSGDHGLKKRIVASRFPTDQAILADISSGGLNVK